VEELLLRLDLPLQELDVVDQQHVDVAVAALEAGGPVVADRIDEVVGELLAAHVANAGATEQAAHVVTDRVEQVGLAQPGVAVDEQRVVGLAGRFGDSDGRGVREPVGRPDDEGLEDVLRVEAGVACVAGDRLATSGLTHDQSVGRPVEFGIHGRLDLTGSRLHHGLGDGRCLLGQRPRREVGVEVAGAHVGVAEAGVDRDREPHRLSERAAERVLEARTEPSLELTPREIVRYRDDRGVLVQRDRLRRGQPGAVAGGQVVDQGGPGVAQVGDLSHRCSSPHKCRRRRLLREAGWAGAKAPEANASTLLSTGCAHGTMSR
jgi:hypothetical protein